MRRAVTHQANPERGIAAQSTLQPISQWSSQLLIKQILRSCFGGCPEGQIFADLHAGLRIPGHDQPILQCLA